MAAGMNAVVLSPTGYVMRVWYIHSQLMEAKLYPVQGVTVYGVDKKGMPKDPIKRAQRPGFVRQKTACAA
jgi:hypothetical protein